MWKNKKRFLKLFHGPVCWEGGGQKKEKIYSKNPPSHFKQKNIPHFFSTHSQQLTSFNNFVLNIVIVRFWTIFLNLLSNMIRIITQQTREWTKQYSLSCHCRQINRLISQKHTSKAHKIHSFGQNVYTVMTKKWRLDFWMDGFLWSSVFMTFCTFVFIFITGCHKQEGESHHSEHI